MRTLPLLQRVPSLTLVAVLVALAACRGQRGWHEVTRCDAPYPQGQVFYVRVTTDRIHVQTGIGAGAQPQLTDPLSVRVGDVLTIEDVDPFRSNLGSGDSVTCLFGGGHADGPPGTPPSDDRSYAVVRRGAERLTINLPRAPTTYTLTVTSQR